VISGPRKYKQLCHKRLRHNALNRTNLGVLFGFVWFCVVAAVLATVRHTLGTNDSGRVVQNPIYTPRKNSEQRLSIDLRQTSHVRA